MSSDTYRMTLGEHLVMDVVANALEKRRLGGYEIRFSFIMIAGLWVFQKGALLGRARADRQELLARLVAGEGSEESMCTFFRDSSKRMLNKYGREPGSFFDFWNAVIFDLSNVEKLKAAYERKYRLGEALMKFHEWAAMGIGLGALNPELVQKMWVQTYETAHDDEWARARQFGLDILAQQDYLPLEEMEEIVLQEVSEFVKEYHPDLIGPLDLRSYETS